MLLDPTFSVPQVADMLDRSDVWVQTTAKRLGVGRMEGKQLRFTGSDLAKLAQKADPNERRGRSIRP